MRVANYMTKDVFTLQPHRKLLVAGDVMEWANCRHVPVVDDQHRLVGLVTHRDLLRASLSDLTEEDNETYSHREHLAAIEVRDVMATDVACIDPEATIQAAARRMRRGKYGCLPVVGPHDELLGIITEHDLIGIVENIDLDAHTEVAPRT